MGYISHRQFKNLLIGQSTSQPRYKYWTKVISEEGIVTYFTKRDMPARNRQTSFKKSLENSETQANSKKISLSNVDFVNNGGYNDATANQLSTVEHQQQQTKTCATEVHVNPPPGEVEVIDLTQIPDESPTTSLTQKSVIPYNSPQFENIRCFISDPANSQVLENRLEISRLHRYSLPPAHEKVTGPLEYDLKRVQRHIKKLIADGSTLLGKKNINHLQGQGAAVGTIIWRSSAEGNEPAGEDVEILGTELVKLTFGREVEESTINKGMQLAVGMGQALIEDALSCSGNGQEPLTASSGMAGCYIMPPMWYAGCVGAFTWENVKKIRAIIFPINQFSGHWSVLIVYNSLFVGRGGSNEEGREHVLDSEEIGHELHFDCEWRDSLAWRKLNDRYAAKEQVQALYQQAYENETMQATEGAARQVELTLHSPISTQQLNTWSCGWHCVYYAYKAAQTTTVNEFYENMGEMEKVADVVRARVQYEYIKSIVLHSTNHTATPQEQATARLPINGSEQWEPIYKFLVKWINFQAVLFSESQKFEGITYNDMFGEGQVYDNDPLIEPSKKKETGPCASEPRRMVKRAADRDKQSKMKRCRKQ